MTPSSELDLAGGEGLVLHDDGAAGGQNHDVQILLPLVGLLVPVPSHLGIVGWDQSHLTTSQEQHQLVDSTGKMKDIW